MKMVKLEEDVDENPSGEIGTSSGDGISTTVNPGGNSELSEKTHLSDKKCELKIPLK